MLVKQIKEINFSHPVLGHPVSLPEVIFVLSFFLILAWRLLNVGGNGGVIFSLALTALSSYMACGRQNHGSSRNVYILIPGACEYGKRNLHGKKDFKDVIKLRTLRWGDYLGLSGRA